MKLGIIAAILCLSVSAVAQDIETVENAFWSKNYVVRRLV